MKEMKTLLLDQTRYEIVDAKSRENIELLNSDLKETNDHVKDLNTNINTAMQNITNLSTEFSTALNNTKSDLIIEINKKQSAGNYLTQETDPTVPSWAKQSKKPTYTAAEVGADEAGLAEELVTAHNTSTIAHMELRETVRGIRQDVNNIHIPEKLPNPEKLIFSGAVTAEYNGSSEVKINIEKNLELDSTMKLEGYAADSKAVGDKLIELQKILDEYDEQIEIFKLEIAELKAYHNLTTE